MEKILRELSKVFERRDYEPQMIFSDWVDIILYSHTGDKKKYLEVANRYSYTEKAVSKDLIIFFLAMSLLLKEMRKTNSDVLGKVYTKWNEIHSIIGEFLIPNHIASFLAKISKLYTKEINTDPSCGAGAILIEAAKQMKKSQLDKALFIGQDTDETCVKMCAINMMFFNLNGLAVLYDPVIEDSKKAYEIKRGWDKGNLRELTIAELEGVKPLFKRKMEILMQRQISCFNN